jgi:hypothetical protein
MNGIRGSVKGSLFIRDYHTHPALLFSLHATGRLVLMEFMAIRNSLKKG